MPSIYVYIYIYIGYINKYFQSTDPEVPYREC